MATPLAFFKYHGLGNDFIVVPSHSFEASPECARLLCDRHRGVGADGVICYDIASRADVPDGLHARMVIYNQDGSRPQMCGNGIRCLARHLVEHEGLPRTLGIATDAGPRHCEVFPATQDSGNPRPWSVRVDMGLARYEEASEPLGAHMLSDGGESEVPSWPFVHVNLGNPHAVSFGAIDRAVLEVLGQGANAWRAMFAEGVNVERVETIGRQHLRVAVYERGVGQTEACGTGACAAAVAAWQQGRCPEGLPIAVDLPGGRLLIEREATGRIFMTGPAEAVFRGEWCPSP